MARKEKLVRVYAIFCGKFCRIFWRWSHERNRLQYYHFHLLFIKRPNNISTRLENSSTVNYRLHIFAKVTFCRSKLLGG